MRPEGRPWRERLSQAGVLTALMLTSLGLYLTVLKWRGPAAALKTQTSWDRLIPFWPSWVLVYLIPYLIGPVVAAWLSRAAFRWFLPRAILVVLISLTIFLVLPTQTVRPPTDEMGHGWLAQAYRQMVGIDEPPANAAPSLHVSLTCLLAWAVVRAEPRWWPAAFLGVGLVWLATLVTYQHHLIDVASGALLASAVALGWKEKGERSQASRGGVKLEIKRLPVPPCAEPPPGKPARKPYS
jgi:hypothetical protein